MLLCSLSWSSRGAVGAGGGSAPISAPDALPLGRKRSRKLSPAVLYTRCRVEGEPITETHRLPLSLTYLQQEQIVPTISISICCAHQGLEADGVALKEPCCADGLHRTATRRDTDTKHKRREATPVDWDTGAA